MPHINTPEYMKAWRQKRKELHLCEKCGKQDEQTLAGRCCCKACSEKANARRRELRNGNPERRARDLQDKKETYKWMKRNHYCVTCKTVDAFTLAGRFECADCAEKRRAAEAEKRERTNLRERHRNNSQNFRDRRKENGLCTACGKPLPTKCYPYYTCERCRAKDRERRRLKREASGAVARSEYKELGLCVKCGRSRVQDKVGWDGREIFLCERCYADALKWAAAGRKAFEEKHGITYRSWATGNEFRLMGKRRSQQKGAANH